MSDGDTREESRQLRQESNKHPLWYEELSGRGGPGALLPAIWGLPPVIFGVSQGGQGVGMWVEMSVGGSFPAQLIPNQRGELTPRHTYFGAASPDHRNRRRLADVAACPWPGKMRPPEIGVWGTEREAGHDTFSRLGRGVE